MKHFLTAAVFAAALIASAAASAQQAPGKSASWELKGLKLGMTTEEVTAKFPGATCKNLAQGIDLCVDETATFAGGPAHVVTKFLDGHLINVTINHISRDQAASAAQGLIAKFGQTSRTDVKWKYVEADDKMENVTTYIWNDGDALMFTNPLDEYVAKTKTQYSAVHLRDRGAHDGIWLARAKNPKAVVATDDL